jgi:serine/threonine-protein kinase
VSTLISGLKIGRKLGNGHFGEVFLGEDEVHGDVAVKVMRRDPGESDVEWDKRKAGLLTEAQKLSRATHPNVVQVHHIVASDDGESIQFCMAYCPGGSLQSAFDKGPMTLAEVRKMGTEVLLGLQALHHKDMLHRDIKPGNILLDGHGVARLGDFGLVTDDLVVGYGSMAGYSDHIAWEVWQTYVTSAKSDIWALGMTLYRLLHGKVWYEESPDPTPLVKKGGFAARLKWLPHVPDRWRRLIRKMMNDDTAARFQSADQVLAAFSKLPIEPCWECTVTPVQVRWERTAKGRRIIVEWDRYAARKHEWRAWSEPLGKGRNMTLGGSGGVIGSTPAVSQLETFFGA